MTQNFFVKFVLFILLFFFSACETGPKKTLEIKKKIPLEVLYSEAYKNFENKNYSDAVKLFTRVETDFPYTEWAPNALLMNSYIYYESSRYIDALTNLQRFKKRYAGNKNIDYAEYLIAMCLFEQVNFVSLSQENTDLAIKQFNKIINDFPKSKYSIDAKFKIDLLYEQLAAKEMYVARYYMKKGKWIPAMYKLNNIIKKYETTIFTPEALHRLVEINYKLGNVASAKKYAAILGYNFNDSDWYKKSYNIVKENNFLIDKEKNKKNFKEKIKELIRLK